MFSISNRLKVHHRRNFVKKDKKRHYHSNSVKETTCSICLVEFEENDEIRKLRCGHVFHCECIDPWLLKGKAVCPVCRQGVYEDEELVSLYLKYDVEST